VGETVRLEPGTRAPSQARRWLAGLCTSWSCEAVAGDAALLVSELATNAVLHASSPIAVRAAYVPPTLTVSVTDALPGDVVHPLPEDGTKGGAEHGRGLFIVRALADEWGVAHEEDGKSVWFRLRTDAA
jgi:anti-sigma regulatory factor (Ser/Thr protein kinase)